MTPRQRLDEAAAAVMAQIKQRRHHTGNGYTPKPMGLPVVCAAVAKRAGLYVDFDDLRYNHHDADTVRLRVYEGGRTDRPFAVLVARRGDDRRPVSLSVDEVRANDTAAMSRGGRIGPDNAATWLKADMFAAW